MADYRISVDTKVNTQQLDKLEQRIKSFNNKPIKVKVDLSVDGSDITRQIDRQIGGKLGVRANLDVGINDKSMNKAMLQAKNMVGKVMNTSKGTRFFPFEDEQYLKTLTNNISKTISKLSNLSLSKGFNANSIKGELANLQSDVSLWKKIVDEIDPDLLDSKLKQSIAETQNNIDRLFSSFDNKQLDLRWAEQTAAETAKVEADINKLRSSLQKVYANDKRMIKLDVDSSMYKELERQNNVLMSDIMKLKTDLNGKIPVTFLDSMSNDAKRVTAELNVLEAQIDDIRRKRVDKFISDFKSKSPVNKLNEDIAKLDTINSKVMSMKSEYDSLLIKMPSWISEYQNTGDIDTFSQRMDRFKTIQIETNKAVSDSLSLQKQRNTLTKKSNASFKLDNAKKTFGLQIDAWMAKNSAAIELFGDRLNGIKARISDVNDDASLAALRSEFQQTTLEAQAMGKATMSLGDKLKQQAKEYGAYLGVAALTAAGGQALRMMGQNVLEVDTAMTGLYRVTDLTAKQYDKLYDDMISHAKDYGSTLTDTINATSDWVRAGFDADTALGLADITAMYQHISDLDYGEASKNLLTAYKGFEETFSADFGSDSAGVLSSVEHVADAFNELDNKFSVTSAGLGEGLARSASALQMAGNTFEQSAAMVGAITEVTQDPEKAGNSLKVLSLRLRGMKGELEELGEESEGVENISKMQGQILKLTNGKVNIFDGAGEFKSTYEIMRDIASVYDELSSTKQADLLETIAGKHRANDVAGLIKNFGTAIEMAETAENSMGSASAENAKYLDSMQGRIDVMTASFQAMSTSVMDSGFLKGGISAITAIIDGFTKLIDTAGVLPTILGGITAGFSLFNKGIVTVDKANERLMVLGKNIGEIKDIFGAFKAGGMNAGFDKMFDNRENPFSDMSKRIDNDAKAFERYQEVLRKYENSTTPQVDIDNALAGSSDKLKEYIRNTNDAELSFQKFSDVQKESFVKLQASTGGFKSASAIIREYNGGLKNVGMSQKDYIKAVSEGNSILGKHLSSVQMGSASIVRYGASLVGATARTIGLTVASTALNMALTMGIGVAIGAAIGWIDKMIHAEENLAKTTKEVSDNFSDERSSLMKNKSDYDSAVDTYGKLSKGVNSLGQNIGLTADEFEQYKQAANSIADVAPDMVAGFDAEGNAILKTSANVDTLTDAYNKLMVAKADAILEEDPEKEYGGLKDIAKDYFNDLNKFEKDYYSRSDNNTLSGYLDTDNIENAIKRVEKSGAVVNQDISRKLVENGFKREDGESNGDFIARAIKEDRNKVAKVVNEANSAYEDMSVKLKNATKALLDREMFGDTEFSKLEDATKSAAAMMIDSWDGEFYQRLRTKSGGDENVFADLLEQEVQSVTEKFERIGKNGGEKILSDAFDFKLDYESGNISMSEFAAKAKELDAVLDKAGFTSGDKKEFMLQLGFEYDKGKLKEVTSDFEDVERRFSEFKDKDAISGWLRGLSGEELNIVANMELNGKESLGDLQEMLALEQALQGVGSIDIKIETEGIAKVNAALKESVSATGVSVDSLDALKSRYADLDSYNPSALFEKTSHGIHLNTEELRRLEDKLADDNIKKVSNDLDTLRQAYDDVTGKIAACTDETERQSLLMQQSQYADRISELEELKAQYEGLTSAYNEWTNAQSSGEEGDMYDDVISKLEKAQELRDKGLVGTNEFAAATEYMSGKDTSSMTPDQIAAAYDEALPKMKRYFTENSDGVNNMLNDINALNQEWAHLGEDGWEIDMSVEDMQKAAEQLGVSVEVLEAVFAKGSDYGLNIEYDDIFYAAKSLEEMRSEAERANGSLRELGATDVEFNFKSESVKDLDNQINSALQMAEQFKNADGTWKVGVEGAEEAKMIIQTLMLQKQEVSKPAFMSVNVSTVENGNLGSVISAMQQIQTYKNMYDIQVAIGANTGDTEAKIGNLISQLQTLKTENPDIFADLNLDTSEFDSALSTLSGNVKAGVQLDAGALSTVQSALSGIDAKVLANVGLGDTSAVDGYTAPEKESKAKYSVDSSAVDQWTPPSKTGTAKYTPQLSGNLPSTINAGTAIYTKKIVEESEANGTAHVDGTAFADGSNHKKFKSGNWGTEDSGTALMGELGQETIVRDGHFFTVGDNGAEFVKYRKGDIIFNHRQTEELFKNGYVTSGGGRGKAYVEGTAFATGVHGGGKLWGSGSTVINNYNYNVSSGSSKSTKSSKSSSSSSSKVSEEAEKFEEVLDWIDVAIDRIERAIKNLDTVASSTFRGWSERTSALNKQIAQTRNEIDLQQRAYDRYMKAANDVGLDAGWAQKVRDGKVDVELITDENVADKVKQYQEWYEKALDARDAVIELTEAESQLFQQRFDNVSEKFDGYLGVIEHEKNMLDEFISQSEARGYITSQKYYEALSKDTNDRIAELKKQRDEMTAEMNAAVDSGAIEKYSQSWYEMVNAIDDVTLEIESANTELLEFKKTMRELDWEVFELIQDRISGITEESDFLIDLMSNKKLYDDKGQLTDEGQASMGLHGVNYNTYMNQADQYAKKVAELNAQIAKDPYNQDLINKRDEYLEAQRESILNAEDEKDAIKSLVEDAINAELDSLDKLIDKRNEALSNAKD